MASQDADGEVRILGRSVSFKRFLKSRRGLTKRLICNISLFLLAFSPLSGYPIFTFQDFFSFFSY